MPVHSYPVRWSGRQAVVTLPDEIDMTNAGQVRDVLARSLEDGAAVLVADMTAATFCAAEGVRVLLRAHAWARAAGAQLRVVVASPAVRRVLDLTGAGQVLQVYPSLQAALAGNDGAGWRERLLSGWQSFHLEPPG